jgi:hypothetical protein
MIEEGGAFLFQHLHQANGSEGFFSFSAAG